MFARILVPTETGSVCYGVLQGVCQSLGDPTKKSSNVRFRLLKPSCLPREIRRDCEAGHAASSVPVADGGSVARDLIPVEANWMDDDQDRLSAVLVSVGGLGGMRGCRS